MSIQALFWLMKNFFGNEFMREFERVLKKIAFEAAPAIGRRPWKKRMTSLSL